MVEVSLEGLLTINLFLGVLIGLIAGFIVGRII